MVVLHISFLFVYGIDGKQTVVYFNIGNWKYPQNRNRKVYITVIDIWHCVATIRIIIPSKCVQPIIVLFCLLSFHCLSSTMQTIIMNTVFPYNILHNNLFYNTIMLYSIHHNVQSVEAVL